MLYRLIYQIFVRLYMVSAILLGLFQSKAAKWVSGQRNVWKALAKGLPLKGKRIWIHCASLGEFEQGRPLIEALKLAHPDFQIILTFFSPSGYEIRKDWAVADGVFYLPSDTIANARRFVEIVAPDLVIFVKYEIWWNYLHELQRVHTPTLLVSAVFRPEQFFFRWYGAWFRQALQTYRRIFVQDLASQKLLEKHGITQSVIAPDTRFDRVWATAQEGKHLEVLDLFAAGGRELMICGSTWPEDEDLLVKTIHTFPDELALIIAPHEVSEKSIANLLDRLKAWKTIRYSEALDNDHFSTEANGYKILVIDNVGLLAYSYQYGKYAYIGGGFGSGIHNVLEAAVFGLPLFFGPRYEKFNEASALVNLGGAFVVNRSEDLTTAFISLYQTEHAYKTASAICRNYVKDNIGGTALVMQALEQYL